MRYLITYMKAGIPQQVIVNYSFMRFFYRNVLEVKIVNKDNHIIGSL